MSRLKELNAALITVLIRYHEKRPSEEALEEPVKILLEKTPTDLLADLNKYVEPHITNAKRGTLLQYILYNILTLQVFLQPFKKLEETTPEAPPPSRSETPSALSPQELQQQAITTLYEQLLLGKKIPTPENLQEQLINLIINIQQLLRRDEGEEHDLNFGNMTIKASGFKNALTRFSSSLCLSGRLLQEELFLPLGLKFDAPPKLVNERIAAIMGVSQEAITLRTENTDLKEKNKRLETDNQQLTRENSRLTQLALDRATQEKATRQLSAKSGLTQRPQVSPHSMFTSSQPRPPAAAAPAPAPLKPKRGLIASALHTLDHLLGGDYPDERYVEEDEPNCLIGKAKRQ